MSFGSATSRVDVSAVLKNERLTHSYCPKKEDRGKEGKRKRHIGWTSVWEDQRAKERAKQHQDRKTFVYYSLESLFKFHVNAANITSLHILADVETLIPLFFIVYNKKACCKPYFLHTNEKKRNGTGHHQSNYKFSLCSTHFCFFFLCAGVCVWVLLPSLLLPVSHIVMMLRKM